MARTLYARCKHLGHEPSFIPARRLTKRLRRQVLDPVFRTCVVLFAENAAEDYGSLPDVHPWVKVLRLVPPDASEPKIFFSYHEQVFRFPQTDKNHHLPQVWLCLDEPAKCPPGPPFPGSLSEELR